MVEKLVDKKIIEKKLVEEKDNIFSYNIIIYII